MVQRKCRWKNESHPVVVGFEYYLRVYVYAFKNRGGEGGDSVKCIEEEYRGRNLGRNWDKTFMSFSPCYSQSPLLKDFYSSPPV
jgi:hypothetical protein